MNIKFYICLAIIFIFGLVCMRARAGFNYPAVQVSNMIPGVVANVGGTVLLAGGCTTSSVSMPGATLNMPVVATPITNPGFGVYWEAWVSAVDTVTLKVCGIVAGTPAVTTYNIRALY